MAEELKAFKREERFIVIKRKHLHDYTESDLRSWLRSNDIPTSKCVVVENDWPEYEKVWAMIEARTNGSSQPPAKILDAEELKAGHAPGLELALSILKRHRIETGGVHLSAIERLESVLVGARAQQSQGGEAVACFRIMNTLGDVVTDWQDGPPPARFTDVCGVVQTDVFAQVAYTHPADQVADPLKQIAWKRRDGVMGCKRFMTQKCHDAQSPQMKGNYEPFYCAHCKADQVAEGVVVSRELLERLAIPQSEYALFDAQEELSALLAKP